MGMRTTIIKDNLQELPEMKAFTAREFGADKVLTINRMVAPTVRGGAAHPTECRLSPEENVELIHGGVVDLWRQVQRGEVKLQGGEDKKFRMHCRACGMDGGSLFSQCEAGISSYVISWRGNMYACELLQQGYTEPFRTGFEEAWAHLPEQYPENRVIEACSTCGLSGVCEACPATRLSETGDWFGIPEYSCREAEYLHKILSDLEMI